MIEVNESEVIVSSSHSIVDSCGLACITVIVLSMIGTWLPLIISGMKKVFFFLESTFFEF